MSSFIGGLGVRQIQLFKGVTSAVPLFMSMSSLTTDSFVEATKVGMISVMADPVVESRGGMGV